MTRILFCLEVILIGISALIANLGLLKLTERVTALEHPRPVATGIVVAPSKQICDPSEYLAMNAAGEYYCVLGSVAK